MRAMWTGIKKVRWQSYVRCPGLEWQGAVSRNEGHWQSWVRSPGLDEQGAAGQEWGTGRAVWGVQL